MHLRVTNLAVEVDHLERGSPLRRDLSAPLVVDRVFSVTLEVGGDVPQEVMEAMYTSRPADNGHRLLRSILDAVEPPINPLQPEGEPEFTGRRRIDVG